jgi:hypothetical protein
MIVYTKEWTLPPGHSTWGLIGRMSDRLSLRTETLCLPLFYYHYFYCAPFYELICKMRCGIFLFATIKAEPGMLYPAMVVSHADKKRHAGQCSN